MTVRDPELNCEDCDCEDQAHLNLRTSVGTMLFALLFLADPIRRMWTCTPLPAPGTVSGISSQPVFS